MTIAIINTGCANLASVDYALQRLGHQAIITDQAEVILKSKRVIIPGVGTAQAAMRNLKECGIDEVLKSLTVPVLGICLGMQILGKTSEESSQISLLDIVHEPVKRLESKGLPLPHMGWNELYFDQANSLFENIKAGAYVYFVHSYGFEVIEQTIAKTHYGEMLSAAIQKDNFYGVQFHPERSGAVGAQLLQNFIEGKL